MSVRHECDDSVLRITAVLHTNRQI